MTRLQGVMLGLAACVFAGCQGGGSRVGDQPNVQDPHTLDPNAGIQVVRQACNEYQKSKGYGSTGESVIANATVSRNRAVALAKQAAAVNDKWLVFSTDMQTYAVKKEAFTRELDQHGVGTYKGVILIEEVGAAGKQVEKACAKLG